MEKITSHQVLGLMEAYNAVYAPQINEEQIWEEVESWVNSLLEEGYDLSEYTWEEMYEEYIGQQLDEVVTSGAPTSATSARSSYMRSRGQEAVKGYQQSQVQSQADAKALQTRQNAYRSSRNTSPGATTRSQLVGGTPSAAPAGAKQQPTTPAPAKYKSSSDGKMYANYNDAKAANNSRLAVQKGFDNTYRAGGGNAAVAQGKNPLSVMAQGSTNLQRQQKPATPASAGTRPTAPARPATPAPAGTRPATPAAASASAKPTPAAPARNGFGAPTAGMAAQGSVSSVTAPASAPAKRQSLASQNAELRSMQAASRQRQGLTQSFDIFDVIKGHLIDEGYADTEEAALQIMANMSEEWKKSIIG